MQGVAIMDMICNCCRYIASQHIAKSKYHPNVFIMAQPAGSYLRSQGNAYKTGHALHSLRL